MIPSQKRQLAEVKANLGRVTSALERSSEKLRRSAGERYDHLFFDSKFGQGVYDRHRPVQPVREGPGLVDKVSNPIIGGVERNEWSKKLGIYEVDRFPQHVVYGDDLQTMLGTRAGIGALTHTLFPQGKRSVKGVFSVELTGSKSSMARLLAPFKTTKGLVTTRGMKPKTWVVVTPNEKLLTRIVSAYIVRNDSRFRR